MYPFTDKKATTKKARGKNTCQYIIIHHTAMPGYSNNVWYLSEGQAQVSVHFVIGHNEEVCKIGDPQNILWHAGQSQRGELSNMNKYSLGIEVCGSGEYNTKQLIRLTDLVEYLMGVYNIPKENILRHCDIAQYGDFSKKKILRDGRRATRKVDIALSFFPMGFEKRRSQLTPRENSRYKK